MKTETETHIGKQEYHLYMADEHRLSRYLLSERRVAQRARRYAERAFRKERGFPQLPQNLSPMLFRKSCSTSSHKASGMPVSASLLCSGWRLKQINIIMKS